MASCHIHAPFKKNNNIIDMIQEFQIRVLPVVASSEQNIISYIADEKGIAMVFTGERHFKH